MSQTDRLNQLESMIEALSAKVEELGARCDALRTEFDAWGEGNKSSPDKRPMTNSDARAVMTGEWKDLDHKTAAEKVGLTYAQVYSARLEFTFKGVHKELREAGWKNPWKK